MTIAELLRTLRENGIAVSLVDGKVKTVAPKGAITPELADCIRTHRAMLLAFLQRVEQQEEPATRIKAAPPSEAYPVSFAQRRLWFIDRLQGGSAHYNLPAALRLRGRFDRDAFQHALDAIVARHAVLRTRYVERDGEPVQIIDLPGRVAIAELDVSAMDATAREARVHALALDDMAREFDLAVDPMLRCALIREGDEVHTVLFTLHHIASDGWSMGVLVREFATLYTRFGDAAATPLPPLPLQYVDFAYWQRTVRGEAALQQALQYWQARLAGAPALHALPLDRPHPLQQTFSAHRLQHSIERPLLDALRDFAQQRQATLFMVLQAAFAALLSRWSGEADIVVGTPVSGRPAQELEPLIGLFINTLVFRTRAAADLSFADLVEQVRHDAVQAFEHQDLPFDVLVDAVRPERTLAHNAVCQIKFVLQNHDGGVLSLPGLELETIERGVEQVRFDLDLTAIESEHGLHCNWTYKQDLFDRVSIERMAQAFALVLRQMVETPQCTVAQAQLQASAATQALLALGRGPVSTQHRERSLVAQVQAQVAATPEAVAVRCGTQWLDYAGLERASNRLAQALQEQGIGPGARVGVALERSVALLVALLGTLKAGAAYVPLDLQQGPARLRQILDDAQVQLVLLDSASAFPLAGADTLFMDEAHRADWLSAYPSTAPVLAEDAQRSVYVLYTSGSTGTPKGVEIAHGSLLDYCAFAREGYYAGHLSGSLVATSVAFDLSVPSLYVPLLSGGCVTLLPPSDPLQGLAQALEDAAAPAWLLRLTPSHVQGLLGLVDAAPRSSRHVFVIGGEAFAVELARALQAKYPQAQLYNHYGPTETVVGCAWYDVSAHLETLTHTIPIGVPMPNTGLYVVDAQGQLVPQGVAGELYIGGAGVGQGYVNQPDLTAQRFLPSPWVEGERVYRSGDRVRWRNDGTLEYLGRLDAQVKLRGYRIELGEIESQLRAQATVREAAVVVSGEGAQARLVAYVVPAVPLEPEAAEAAWTQSLQQALSQVLPGYMQPTAYVVLAALPLTANGKLDRAALPQAQVREAAYTAPCTPTEQALAQIWEAVLGQERISTEANFFALGGHSLLATRIVSEIGKRLGKPVPVRALFEQPTLQGLGRYVDGVRAQGHAPIPVLPREQPLALSFAQQRLWFIDRLEGGSAQYNMPVALQLDGDLDRTALRAALAALVARHEVLRTVYAEQDGQAVQVIVADATVPLLEQDLRELDAAVQAQALQQQREEEARQPFDLERGPMLRCRLLRLQAQRHALLFTMHHIASDGWSVGVLVQEFAALYAAQVRGEAAALAALPVQYADYAAWQRQRLQGATLQGHLGYWREQLAQLPVVHSLPLDAARPAQQRFDGGQWEVALPAPTLAALGALGQAHGASLFMVLEAALATVLWRWSGERDIVIGTPIAGRLHPDVEPLIGFFVNTLVLRTQIAPQARFVELLQARRERILEAYTHQEVPFEMLVDELKPVRSLSHGPLFQVLLSMRNNARVALTLPGLEVSGLEGGEEPAKFDLQLSVTETGDGARLRWNYARSLFEAATIARLGQAYVAVLEAVAAAPQTPLQALPWVDAATQATLAHWNATAQPVEDLTYPALVRRQALATPEAVAVRAGEQVLRYGQLDARANALAHRLRAQGVGRETVVALCLARGLEVPVAILGVMKAGAAYLPLDPAYPDGHLQYVLADSGAVLVLTDAASAERVAGLALAALPQLRMEEVRDLASAPPTVEGASASDLAYVLYTSGTSGRPKGVLIEHGSLRNLAKNLGPHGIADGALQGCWAWTASYAFDGSLKGLMQLAWGGELLIVEEAAKTDPVLLRSVLEGQRVDLIDCTPSLLEAWLGAGLEDCLPHLVIGGEAIGASLWQRLVEWQQQRRRLAINVYGPTECCVDTTWSLVQGPVPVIGRALANVQCHVLAEDGQVQPIGVAGELYIGGAGVGRGYHGQPALTAQRFLPSPWVEGERVYRSGDRVRWRNDGTLEYLGRLDAQVKLRGYRIELGEIESQLRAQATVREAAVVVSGEGAQARLVAYVVPAVTLHANPADAAEALEGLEAAEAVWTQSLQQALSQVLPGYMQPTAYVVLAALPLTANGKLDRAALPQAQVREAAYTAPCTPTEQALAQIWEAVLGQERISTEANFFEIGGDSILSIQIVARANQAGIGISTRQLFQSQTISQLARHADHANDGTGMLATQAEVQGALPLLPIQRAFLEANDRDPHHYNQALLLEAPAALDPINLHRMVAALYRRHDALRLRFRLQEGQWLAEHAPLDDATLEAACVIERLPHEPLAFARAVGDRCDHWQGAFELGRGPLLRAVYLHNDAQARLLLVAHHLVVDGVSWRILLADLGSAHAQAAAGEEIVLPPKTASLQQWAQAVHAHAGSHALAAERSYWLAQARRTLPSLPVDRAGTDHGPVCSAAHVGFALPDAVSRILLQHGNRAYRTQVNELLLAGVLLGMRRWSGHAGLRLGLEGHGRGGLPDELDTSQTVGWFTTLYPLLLWSDADDAASTIKAVKEQYRAVPAQGLGYAVLRELTADSELRAAEEGQPIALTFNYLGQSDHAAEQAGPFRAAPESAGHSIGPHRLRRHALTLKGVAAAGQLRFTLEYSRDRYDAETASAIVAALESAFHAVASHCAQCERPALTPSDVPLAQLSQEPLDALQAAFPDMVALYPATPMQQGLLFHTRLDPEAYITQTFPILRGALDAPRFRAAWQSLLDRHEVFRTAFVEVGERLLQLVGASAALPWHEEDWRELDAQAQEAQFERYRQQDRARGFDVACAPLLRIALFRLDEERYRLLWTHHHMLSDGWSLPILYKEVMQVYTASLHGTSVHLPPAPRYEAYVDWLSQQDRDAALTFWQSQLATIEAPTPLAIDKLPSDGGFGQRERSLTLDAATSERLSAFARGQRVTLNTVLQLAWGYLLHRYSGEDEVVFGATISGRPAEIDGIESMVGLFINSVPVRTSFAEPHSVGTMLADLQQRFERANAFGYLSLADIQRQSGIAPGTALFDSLMVIGNYPIEAAMQARSLDAGLQVEATGRREQTGYRLAFNIGVRSRIHLQCAYPAEIFADATIDRLLGHFAQVLQRMPALVDQPVHLIDPLGEAEHRDRALWNAVPADYPRDATLHALVEARAHAHPQAVAATFGEQAITYGELNREANRVAHFLRQRDVAVDTLVGLCIERSVEMLIGMLGILKAGAAYLPLDPDYPEDRLRFMLEDAGAEIVLTSSDLLHALDVFDERLVLPLDATLRESLLGDCAQTDPVPVANAQSLAYAIYTSGSTGTPKGTLIEHRNVVRLVHRPNYVVLAEGEVMAQASNSSFDAATFEIWGALANGMHLHGIGKDTLLNPAALATTLQEARVATLFVTTAIFNQMSLVAPGGFAALDTLLFGGEGVDVEAVGRVLAAGKPRHLVHVYGPTENTTFSTAFEIVERRFDTYPIGTPISGTTLYVLDTQRRPVPYGAVGELYLGGDGVGRGYHARPQLDAERFLDDPFAVTHGARLYRTGDLVRQAADGNVQFVGRADDQVKLRGFRIELGEIETRLLSHEAVREAVVVARRDQEATRLVAYVVRALADEQVNESLFAKELRRYLKQRMPEYMVPSAFVCMEELPLTRNGKVDKRQLPAPDYQLQQAYVAPRTELEARLAELWQQVLRVDQVGVHDNFFEIGGDSILSIQVVSRANQAGIRMSTRQLFENQTVAELATVAACAEETLAPQEEVQGEMLLLPVQRMFLEGEAVDRHHFNQAVLLTTPSDFDLQTLDAVLAALYARHDALRLRFTEDADGWQARHVPLHPDMVLESRALERLDGSDSTWAAQVSARCADWQRRFDLADGPLLRAVYFPSWSGDGGRLLLAVHHIVVDGVSWRILLDDLQLAYSQIQRGQSIQLGRKSASFQRWGQTLEAYACDPALLQEKAYWAAAAAVPGLPVDRPGVGAGSNASTRLIGFGLSPEETRALQQQCHAAYRTQINELLLAAVYLGVRRWCGQTALRIRLEGHGREALDEDMDLTQTVGWFTSLYPLRLSSDGQALGDVIKAVKEQYRSVPRRGIGYGVLRYLRRDPDLIAAAHDEHDGLLFNYLGQFDQVLNDDTAFQPAPESIGPQTSLRRQRAALLSLSGKTFAGQLQFTLSYGSDRYEAASMRALADAIEGALREIVAHCRHAHSAGFTPSDFPLARVGQAELDRWQHRYPRLQRLYPATPMQAGLLYETLLDRSAYVIQNYPVLRGDLDLAAFRQAWHAVVARHDVFRTAFVGDAADLQQLVLEQAPLEWQEEDWSVFDDAEQARRFEAFRQQDRQRGFDFAQPPLMRVAVFHLGAQRYQLLWSLHHILLDGWCLPLVYRDVIELYRAALEVRAPQLPAVPPYEHYIAWLQARDAAAAREYWRRLLQHVTAPTPLPMARPRVPLAGQREHWLELSEAQTQVLLAFAQAHRTTVNTLLQWAWAYLLHRYSGEADVVFGATISGRAGQVAGIEDMVGLFINSIPVKVSFGNDSGLAAALSALHADFQQGSEYGYLALSEIQRQSGVRAGTALFDSLLVFENYPMDALADDAGTSASTTLEIERPGNSEATSYALTLTAGLGRTLRVKFGYRGDRFCDMAVRRTAEHLARILDQMSMPESAADCRFDLLTDAERAQFAVWNETDAPFPRETCVHTLFEVQAALTPDAVALEAGDTTLTYAALNMRANQLAHALIGLGVAPDDRVGLRMHRSIDLVVAILAVLKAGGAYLPLDPEHPPARTAYMVRDSGARIVVTTGDLERPLLDEGATVLALDAEPTLASLAEMPVRNPEARERGLGARNLAYAIYTSGSTGEPKCVLNEHEALVNRLDWMQKAYPLGPDDRVLQKTPFSFDVSVWEFLWPLLTGARLSILAPGAHQDPAAVCDAIRRHGITTLHFVPSMLSVLLAMEDWASCRSVRQVLCSGEALSGELAQRFFATGTQARLYNLYGPTEAAIDVSAWECRPGDTGATVPIGRPIQNLRLHVLDASGALQVLGVPGELCIGGVGLARGYCNKPELTRERFVADSVDGLPGARLYRTGDLARWLPDGSLEFLGRLDHQVKLRGLRIELGEIEAQLRRQAGVDDAVVVVRGDAEDSVLVAYLAMQDAGAPAAHAVVADRLRAALGEALPSYMLPAAFVVMARLPLNANGKLDRAALPEPQAAQGGTDAATPTERVIAELWQTLLKRDAVDVTASFFTLGGHSLLAVRMIGEVRSLFDLDISIRDVFERTSVRALAAHVDACLQRRRLHDALALDVSNSNPEELIEL